MNKVRNKPNKSREEETSRRSRSEDGDSARSQLIQICRLLRAPYQTLPVHDSLDSIGNRPSISPKPTLNEALHSPQLSRQRSEDRSYQLTSEAYLNHPSASRQCTPGSEAPEPAVAAYDPRKEVPAKRLLDQMPL
ncbi:hypothetical protein FRX31_031226 [Thalictrum thalictroides]|uniref:Uncharacterized protein n=1 Tax=Thalictrum thalictroides TaxID=46969 RepID=A0A7J6V2J8_THATH|nr:hypothetical protein FRX31_031226 [Thalictrum thalictroides]